jgi:hypothetical protein
MDTAVSPTRRRLTAGQVERWVAAALGDAVRVVGTGALAGGEFATVLRVALSDGREVVLKVGPAPGTALLGYEEGMVAAETRYLRLAGPDALARSPLPRLLGAGGVGTGLGAGIAQAGAAAGGAGGEGEWMLTELLPGVTLASLGAGTVADPAVAPGVREAVGAALARIHTVSAPDGVFGYDGARVRGATWGVAFAGIIASLLADAERWDVRLPVDGAQIMGLIARAHGVLDEVRRPALVHFDLWDGNVLCSPGADGGQPVLTGLVDGERYLFGDPLVDFVSPALFRRIEDEPGHPFLRGYGHGPGFSGPELLRLALYRMHLYLLMVVEMPSRGRGGPEHAERAEWLGGLLLEAVRDVRERAAAG